MYSNIYIIFEGAICQSIVVNVGGGNDNPKHFLERNGPTMRELTPFVLRHDGGIKYERKFLFEDIKYSSGERDESVLCEFRVESVV